MTVEILDKAEDDLVHGFQFYETQQPGTRSWATPCSFMRLLIADANRRGSPNI